MLWGAVGDSENRNDAEVAIAADAGVQAVKKKHSGVPTEGLGLLSAL